MFERSFSVGLPPAELSLWSTVMRSVLRGERWEKRVHTRKQRPLVIAGEQSFEFFDLLQNIDGRQIGTGQGKDAPMRRGCGRLRLLPQFLCDLLALFQADEFDRQIFSRRQTRKETERTRHLIDIERLAHIE